MNVYRLDPINLDDPSWNLSTVKEVVWAAADTPNDARALVAIKTVKAIRVTPGTHGAKLISPWHIDTITSCVWDTTRTGLKDGEVVTASGERLPKE